MNSLLRFSNIHLQYQNGTLLTEVIKGIDFTIYQNEKLAIVGKSGSGKTSLLMLMAGLEKPTSGNITYNDQDITTYTEDQLTEYRKKNIGIVFQSFYLIPNYTALENVALSLEINFQKDALSQAKEILIDLGLEDRLNHFPSQLSGGEQQRVAIARAMIKKPELILADEPTGNLDSKTGADVMNLFKELNNQGQTIILITHEDNIAAQSNRIITIMDGLIKSDNIN